MSIQFQGRVAIVTGAGGGLGRSYALALAAGGAKVLVNDLGATVDGSSGALTAASAVAEDIRSKGGEAIAHGADVADFAQVQDMAATAKTQWGRIDILINNAGILRDRSFAKMDPSDLAVVLAVHLTGSFNCCKAVWETMREQGYGRILLTNSGSGLYGNFCQANYAAAKAAMVGLMNALGTEGQKYGIRVNAIAPAAATRMTAGILPPDIADLFTPEAVAPAVLMLVGEEAPTRTIMAAGAGCYAVTRLVESEGVYLPEADRTPEMFQERFAEIAALNGARVIGSATEQTDRYARKAARTLAATPDLNKR